MEKNIEDFVLSKLENDKTGHDFHHSIRVKNTAVYIASKEGNCDMEIVICASLLHDVCDVKICKDPQQAKAEMTSVMERNGLSAAKIEKVMEIINSMSFKGANVDTSMRTSEGKAVQDADRLDALGAVGIARCFAYGGSVGHQIYDPSVAPTMHSSEAEYRSHKGTSISHFYEKLLLLKDKMQTNIGKSLAERRTKYMEDFLSEFYDEWNGLDIK